jgi:hypothetical protein
MHYEGEIDIAIVNLAAAQPTEQPRNERQHVPEYAAPARRISSNAELLGND